MDNRSKYMRLIVIAILLIVTSCYNNEQMDGSSKSKDDFSINNLTKLNLPFKGECGQDYLVYDKDSINKFAPKIPEYLRFGGLLKDCDSYIAVLLVNTLADFQIHYLTTLDKSGNIIEQYELFSNNCAQDAYFWGMSDYIIDENLNIIQKDSSATYERDSIGEIIEESVVTEANRLEIFVNDRGEIKKK